MQQGDAELGKTVAITGVNSYFASTVLPKLEADPEIETIIGIDVTPWRGGFEKVTFHKEDIRSDKIADLLTGVDVLYHLAFIVGEIQDKEATRDININGSRNVFSACARNRVEKVIYTSSMTVYGSRPDNPIGITEELPVSRQGGNYYNSSKVEVEDLAMDFFKDHPRITLTILRAALLVGPGIDNMFSRLWSLKLAALPAGNTAHNQLIHEEDLGEALYLAYEKDVPGIYNVTADDAVPTRWCFRTAGAVVLSLPELLLKPLASAAFKLRVFPASGGWVRLSKYTVFGLSDKFKKATGWQPKYTSAQAFLTWIKARERDPDRRDDLYHAFLSWGSRKSALMRLFLTGLHAVFRFARLPAVRSSHPWMDPRKNSMSYLPINRRLEQPTSTALPPQVVFDFIERASTHVMMDTCGCRTAHHCQNFTNEIGCLFMGESALDMPVGASRKVTKEEALQHARKAISLGLIPLTGKVRVDNFLMMTPDRSRLLTVCFCCHCCCMMGFFKHIPPPQLDQVISPIEGLSVEVTETCVGCGTCIEYCVFEAISVEDGVAVHSDQCRGCGRCEINCPQNAVKISVSNPNVVEDVEKRIESHLEAY
jgi:UDP-glucose 4-epimerase